MSKIKRDPASISKRTFDLIIIGGGIYGTMLSFISAQKGIKSLLLEKDDFGGATSFNSLRILHGGLRYLQKLDIHRFFESVSERKWFMKNFSGLVEPIPCLMPLYGRGIYRVPVFRAALLLNDLLSVGRNTDVPNWNKIPSGKIVDANKVKNIFPLVDDKKLKGGAVWYDGSIPDSQIVIKEILKKSCEMGSEALNYFEVKDLITEERIVKGVLASDVISGQNFKLFSPAVINAAGPWSREISKKFDNDYPELFKSSIAWNILFDREALSDHALAVTPNRPGAPTLFLRPWKGKLFAGTIHEPWNRSELNPIPSANSIQNFINDLNSSIPKLNILENDILHIYAGLLPAKYEGSSKLAVREVILDHSHSKGPKGLFSLSGVKFTTARLVALKALDYIFPNLPGRNIEADFHYDLIPKNEIGIFDFNWFRDEHDNSWKENLKKIIDEESVMHLDDLILRRTDIGDNPLRALELAFRITGLFGWDAERKELEVNRLENFFKQPLIPESVFKNHKSSYSI
ncbi:MAG TPA: FAD-dependent oxidoreductase [Ignavibacteriaceae bacterium]|nr:FAD-dependent oxidoreductase [Ignavibacteriaceae bacterium]